MELLTWACVTSQASSVGFRSVGNKDKHHPKPEYWREKAFAGWEEAIERIIFCGFRPSKSLALYLHWFVSPW
jgi:hypothetical protein